jgi:hypothetical protein
MGIRDKMRSVRASAAGPVLNYPRRVFHALPVASSPLLRMIGWSFTSREDTNFTYKLTDSNLRHLAHTIAVCTQCKPPEALNFIFEAMGDQELARHVISARNGPDRSYTDARADFAKRLGWYAVARIIKPSVIVETGVDKGLGSVVLAAALARNGFGRYYGTDIDITAGSLLSGEYAKWGEVLYGDSLDTLRRFDKPIDLFINDSDHSAAYEAAEYRVIGPKLSRNALVLGDNAHATDELMSWSEEVGRHFLFWAEKPRNHWYPGAGIGFSFT